MKYVYLANNRVGYEALRWLVSQGYPPAGLVVHPLQRGRYRDDIVAASGLPQGHILEATSLNTDRGLEWLAARRPDWLVSVYFGYIMQPAVIALPAKGAINLHPALLPYNRGAYPNVWSIVDRTPAGVTIHFVDEGVDTGDIIARREVQVLPTDTGASLYARLEQAALALFIETWPALCDGTFQRSPQPSDGSSHRRSDVAQIDRIDPDQLVRAGDLIDIIRARTFPPYRGAYLDLGDRRILLRLELTEESPGADS